MGTTLILGSRRRGGYSKTDRLRQVGGKPARDPRLPLISLSRDDAFRLAFGESARVVAASSHRVGKGVLGKREIEVAQLVADGMTKSRAQIAGWFSALSASD